MATEIKTSRKKKKQYQNTKHKRTKNIGKILKESRKRPQTTLKNVMRLQIVVMRNRMS